MCKNIILFIVISLILKYIFHHYKLFVSVGKRESTGEREQKRKRVKKRGNGLFIEMLQAHER